MQRAEHTPGLEGNPAQGRDGPFGAHVTAAVVGTSGGWGYSSSSATEGAREGRRPVFPQVALSLLRGTHCVVGSADFPGLCVAPAPLRGESVGPCRYGALGGLGKPCSAARLGLSCSVILLNSCSGRVSPPCPQPFHAVKLCIKTACRFSYASPHETSLQYVCSVAYSVWKILYSSSLYPQAVAVEPLNLKILAFEGFNFTAISLIDPQYQYI